MKSSTSTAVIKGATVAVGTGGGGLAPICSPTHQVPPPVPWPAIEAMACAARIIVNVAAEGAGRPGGHHAGARVVLLPREAGVLSPGGLDRHLEGAGR